MNYVNFKFVGRGISSEAFLSEEGIVTMLKYKNGKLVDKARTEKDVFDEYIKVKLEEEAITIVQ